MQRKIKERKVVEAYEGDMKKTPHVSDKRQLESMEELDLEEPKYTIGAMFYNDKGNQTLEIVAYEIGTDKEVGRLLCRNIEDINTFMSGAYCLFAEAEGDLNRKVICTIEAEG